MIRYSRNFLVSRCMAWKYPAVNVQISRHCYSPTAEAPLDNGTWLALKSLGLLRRYRGCRGGKYLARNCNSYSIKTLIPGRNCGSLNIQDSACSARTVSSPVKRSLIYIKPIQNSAPNQTISASFCLLNARSINNKSFIIKDFVVDQNVDILALTETWIRSDNPDQCTINNLCPNGYSFQHISRKTKGGGVALLYKQNL